MSSVCNGSEIVAALKMIEFNGYKNCYKACPFDDYQSCICVLLDTRLFQDYFKGNRLLKVLKAAQK